MVSSVALFTLLFAATSAKRPTRGFTSNELIPRSSKLFKVALTQKGYIQFLRYQVAVPEMLDFTYCLWMRTKNFTHPHPLFSYSQKETQRVVRGWLSPSHQSALVHMEVLEQPVMRVRIELMHYRWYHFCQSWNSAQAHFELHINGELVASGTAPTLRGKPIPGGGDVVVGQELTDADKGLDDGIEGEVFGFNLVTGGGASLGRQLARYGYHYCTAGRGAPPISKGRYLINWPETPIRVFGGATVMPARPVCRHF
ncbi:pentraxin-related protein PTX3-like [Anabrus simplex]|uniref:pentraxin-related protein PTX3-like n=1 Tax=Anabrus simplex TaxID=316456 RepID=UPI0035A28CF4